MATTDESNKKAAEDFQAGYDEDKAPQEQSDDEAFGLMPDEAPGVAAPAGSAPTVAVTIEKDEAEAAPVDAEAEPAAEAAPEPAAEAPAAEAAAPALDVAKETQRLKSWEGRLKAKEAALSAEEVKEEAESPMHEMSGMDAGDEDDADVKALGEDFGPEFVGMLKSLIQKEARKIAGDTASEHSAANRGDIDAIIARMNDGEQRAHYEKISDAYPDFMDIGGSDQFKAWIAGQDETQKADTEAVVSGGSAKQIIAMLKTFKESADQATPGPDSDLDAAIDDAEGVRSTGGMQLPAQPGSKDDFAAGWNDER